MNVNRLVSTVTSATCAVVGEVAINVSAGSIDLPKSSYAVPVAGFVLAVIIVGLSDRTGTREPRRRSESSTVPAGSGRERIHVLKGTQKKRKNSRAVGGIALFFAAYAFALIGAGVMSSARHDTGAVRSQALIAAFVFLGLSPAVAVLGVWLFRAVRTTLTFSSAGITLSDAEGDHVLRWDQARNFHTLKPFVLTVYLVAEPVDGSEYFLGPWGFDKGRGLIRVCDLTLAGIKPSDVDGALRFWRDYA